jgi:hypothetical protein
MNKGRDFYRLQQAWSKRILNRSYVPTEGRLHERVFQAIRGDDKIYCLSNAEYVKRNAKNKIFKAIGPDGKECHIPYQSCTYIRAENVR